MIHPSGFSLQPHFFITLALLLQASHIRYSTTLYAYAINDDTSNSANNNADYSAYSYDHNIPLDRFQGLLNTEIYNEIHVLGQSFLSSQQQQQEQQQQQQEQERDTTKTNEKTRSGIRSLDSNRNNEINEELIDEEEAKQHLWDHVVQHGWQLSETLMTKVDHDDDNEKKQQQHDYGMNTRFLQVEEQRPVPFLICSKSPLYQGYQRLKPMLKHTQAVLDDVIIVSNNENETCYHITTTSSKARFVSEVLPNEEYIIVPMTDLMKISVNTLGEISKDYWALPTNDQRRMAIAHEKEADNEDDDDEVNEDMEFTYKSIRNNNFDSHDWERIIHVSFVCGDKKMLNEESALDIAEEIVNDVQQMGQQGSHNRRTRRTGEVPTPKFGKDPIALSVTEAFSLTSSTMKTTHNTSSRRIQALQGSRAEALSQSLERGMEADHSCSEMFDRLTVRADDTYGFDIVLNPDNPDDDEEDEMFYYENDETSASNVHCITSLIIALSTHPKVLTVEQVGPVVADDVESSYITQSLVPPKPAVSSFTLDSFPLYDVDLDGRNQVIAVADSGLDINHRFFGPTNKKVFNQWDTTQRTVVRYYTEAGDDREWPGGHGSKVAGAAVANLKNNKNYEGNGVARGAKLFIWDMARQGGGLREPSTSKFFQQIHNNGNGARIANGSWSIGTSYTYSSRCARYDEQLYKHPEISYFTSSGNSGPNADTIDDPGVCKNVVAVGSSQSLNKRITSRDRGPSYLADYSSRGPVGTIKPELVTPGYTVLTAYGNHTGKPRDDDTSRTSGTSFSSPIAAGCAAQVRQYYEDGFYPYGSKNSGNSMTPSGPLVKATLMNGAQQLYGVQDLPGKEDITSPKIEVYDNNQGFGLINLKASLPISGQNDIKAVVVNDFKLKPGNNDYAEVKVTSCSSGSPLSASLAWNDLAGAVNCNNCAINKFSLVIKELDGPGGNTVTTKYPNGENARVWDLNSQRIRINNPKIGKTYKISVDANNANMNSDESYSMIVTGCFKVQRYDEDGGLQCKI